MEFRVGARGAGDPFVPPRRLSTIRRLPPVQVERLAALVEADGMLTLHELADVPAGEERPGEPLIAVTDDQGDDPALSHHGGALRGHDELDGGVRHD